MTADASARYRKRHPDRVKASRLRYRKREYERAKERRAEDWPTFIMPGLRYRAKKAGLEFSITPEDIKMPERCPVFGLPLQVNRGAPKPNSPSVDRLDNTKGYTPDNCRVISHRANWIKKYATADDLRKILAYMEAGHDNDCLS